MLQVRKIIGKLLSSNIYLLSELSSPDSWLIDIGDPSIVNVDLNRNASIKGVFLTHGHFDHMSGINELCSMFPDCKVYTSEYGKEELLSSKKNFSLYHEMPVEYNGRNIIILHDGDVIRLYDDVELHVLETPGHSPSCLTYYTEDFIFTGDSYNPDVPVVTKLPKGNRKQSADSVKKILELAQTREILAGHDKDKWVSII